ncbi:MAG TPA: PilZ domain-containing protein [Gemmatimonadales bacterium]|nr:PilZ domain-containing protein [Gemmatimonadales bacterium]
MAGSSPTPEPVYSRKRRSLRASFAPNRRPHLVLSDGRHPVLDVSLHGLRIRHMEPVRPELGSHLSGTLEFPDPRPPLTLEGIVIRVQAADVVLEYAEGVLPADWVMAEVERNQANGGPKG